MNMRSAPSAPSTRASQRRQPDAGAPAGRLSPQAWVTAATDVLVDQDIDHVRVDLLATQLQVTRGSFYWHFKDREALLRAVLSAWQGWATADLTARIAQANLDSRAQLHEVLSLPFHGRSATKAANIELAIRAWARRDQLAQHAVNQADANRIAYIAQLFSALGFGVAEARSRALVAYSVIVAAGLLPLEAQLAPQDAHRAFVEQLLTQPLR